MRPDLLKYFYYLSMLILLPHRYKYNRSLNIFFISQYKNFVIYPHIMSIKTLNSNIFRFFTYRAEKAHFYMIDFCYFVNLSAILQTLFCGCEGSFCGQWFQLNYILTQGPIATAIVLWGNSLVFHSLDKVGQS